MCGEASGRSALYTALLMWTRRKRKNHRHLSRASKPWRPVSPVRASISGLLGKARIIGGNEIAILLGSMCFRLVEDWVPISSYFTVSRWEATKIVWKNFWYRLWYRDAVSVCGLKKKLIFILKESQENHSEKIVYNLKYSTWKIHAKTMSVHMCEHSLLFWGGHYLLTHFLRPLKLIDNHHYWDCNAHR